ncbi:hypothetical protein BDV27DRAFT_122800 [Aspergillus caelatus]|uniref:Uncharacterized protein n=1 Tax=Aspergillus caelatus TaxID=61420 RepID=A0A5N7AEG4_9EURO|nr:uncharacterized protein BDV27DRAFT_122800 [Aspergillus caelatus]KAE8368105.1 hypothetical protein BDV27DRAFT_122800 [Aspergillus caelatus]
MFYWPKTPPSRGQRRSPGCPFAHQVKTHTTSANRTLLITLNPFTNTGSAAIFRAFAALYAFPTGPNSIALIH